MSRYIIQEEIEDIEELKKLDVDGYIYNEEMSTEKDLVFTREQCRAITKCKMNNVKCRIKE